MGNLVQKVKIQLPGSPEIEMYMYGEATLEANQEMQPVLEKLYKYENQPDMREKVREYINELDIEIERIENIFEKVETLDPFLYGRVTTLTEVKNDLLGRLDEVV